jgi:pantoate--beta-alanine ligase
VKVIRTLAEMRCIAASIRQAGGTIGFVPTMGALHPGHAALIQTAAMRHSAVVVSVFVNPTQFAADEDFSTYPRQEEADIIVAKSAGATHLFLPSVSELYPSYPELQATVSVHGVASGWEAQTRPTHFDGVAIIVLKLLLATSANESFFGQKDLQQIAVIRTMCTEFHWPGKISIVPTVRHDDGLAMSSRNVYLSTQDRAAAPLMYESMLAAAAIWAEGVEKCQHLLNTNLHSIPNFSIDYAAVVDPFSLQELVTFDKRSTAAIIVAGRFPNVRLIDNLIFPVTS